ncbi:MAG: 3'(2'),5'-bisphosphate nucleotidase CysQ [Gemmataceae bacterium]|nr:3'(2'),5'-bisphosphate nucleotidase CysQ [Gemmataceae bacterium]
MHERELAVALEAVHAATEYLVQEYDRFQQIPDAPADITTEADRQAQEILLQHLTRAFPGDALCAEENTPTLQAAAHTGPRLWIIDPIDGTRGFAQKNGEFSVMVGFVDQGQIVLGIVAQPATQRLTYATHRGGCWRRDGADAAPVRCRVTDVDGLERATLTQSRSRHPDKPSRWVQGLRPAQVIESHSAGIKLALVARGAADLYLNTYDAFHDWDICAGHILVSEAGGTVTGSDGQPLVCGLPGAWQRHGLLATNGKIHDAALTRLAPLLKSP